MALAGPLHFLKKNKIKKYTFFNKRNLWWNKNIRLANLAKASKFMIGPFRSHITMVSFKIMVGHLFQNYDTIYVRFFPTYTCNHSCYTIYVRFFVTYTCVLFPSIWPFSYKRAYICGQKSSYICVTNTHVVYGVTENRRIRGTELSHQQKEPLDVRWSWKVTSVWIKHGRNGRVNFEQDLALPSQQWWLLAPRQRICWNSWTVSWETVYAVSQMLTETTIDSVRN